VVVSAMAIDQPNEPAEADKPPEPAPPPLVALPPEPDEAPEPTEAAAPQDEPAAPPAPEIPDNKRWYVVKVQSGREESIKEAIERRVKIEGLAEYFGKIIIPVERVTEMSRGKRVVKERKLYPGYLMVNLEFNDRMLYLFRETSGVGDFVGGSFNKPPPPMSAKEVERLEKSQMAPEERTPDQTKSPFEKGDHVKVKDGTFAGMEGSVKDILEHKGAVVVELTIFGRPVPVELEYWQVDEA
jgi:transcription termination/antitermination protein NusG